MRKTAGLGPWVLVAALTAAVVGPGSTRQASSTAQNPASTGGPSKSPESATVGTDDDLDTLDTVSASLALDTTNEGLRRRALYSLKQLGSPGPARTPLQRVAVGYLQALFRLPLRASAGLQPARDAMAVLAHAYADDSVPGDASAAVAGAVPVVNAFLERYFDRYALTDKSATKDAVLLAQDFDQLQKDDLKVELLRLATQEPRTDSDASGVAQTDVEFLIATLPDPIDSYTGWQFDPMLEAITQAVSANDYVLDRSHFPDSDKEEAGGATGTQHDLEPGIVVFRKFVDVDDAQMKMKYGDRLVLLVVHENPAAGIHVRALSNAIRLVVRCRALTRDRIKAGGAPQAEPTIRILGPTFSGSSETLTRALKQVEPRLPPGYQVRVMSGSATDSRNKATIESVSGPRFTVRFTATVHPDDELLPKLVKELGQVGWSRQVAVLFEANTQYGRQIAQAFWENRHDEDGRLSMISLPFSMNISRLRTTVQTSDSAPTGLLGLPARFRHVEMEAKGNPADLIPQFNPKTSAAYMELGLASLLQTIQRERVKTVALMATDSRDKLFLAQELSRYAPDVSIFTAESDSLYIHPDYSSFLRGTMVASTYALHSGNQRWSYGYQGDEGGRQFANGSAQGIYNATLALLAYDAQGRPVREDPPRLIEYGFPGEDCASACQPPVWVSVVGSGSAWPLAAYHIADPRGYVFTVAAPATPGALAVFPSVSFYVVLALLTTALLTALFLQFRNGPQILTPPSGQTPDRAQAALGYTFAGLTAVLIAQAVLFGLCAMRLSIGDRTTAALIPLATAAAGLIAGGIMAARVLVAIRRALPSRLREGWRQRRSTWVGAITAAVLAWSSWNLTTYGLGYLFGERSQALSFLARSLDLGNGVSPTVPILFLCFAFAVWAGTEVARVRRGRVVLADAAVHPVVQEMVYGDVQALKEPWGLLNRSLISVPWSGVALVTAACAATCIFAFNPFTSWLVTTEGPRFGRFVSITLLLVQAMLGLGLVQFAYLWCHLRRLLLLMARHPLAEAYDRVPKELFPTTLIPRATRLLDLQLAVTHADRVLAELDAAPGTVSPAPISATYEREMRGSPDLHWAASQSWAGLLNAASLCASRLRLPVPQGSGGEASGSPATPIPVGGVAVLAAEAVIQRQAELPAMVAALVVRDAVVRLAHNLTFVIGGILLVFASYTFFPFQQHTDLQVLGWIDIGIAFATILTVLVQIKRNPVIASLTTPAGAPKTTWDTDFVLKVAVFALLPLLTLFAAQFPDLGGVILRWLEPVQKALP